MDISSLADRIQSAYRKHERLVGFLFFAGGMLWDALTLRRIDNLVDNAILMGYLILLVSVVTLSIRSTSDRAPYARLAGIQHRIGPWLQPAKQFLLGALLSAFVIFYARSIAWVTHLAFWIILVVGLVANEFLHRRVSSVSSLLVFLMVSLTSMLAWLLPVVFGSMSPWLFYLAVSCGFLMSVGIMLLAQKWGQVRRGPLGPGPLKWLVGMALLFVVGYQQNWIPPVPLSLQFGGIYNNVERTEDGYLLNWHTRSTGLFSPDYAKTFFHTEGDTVHAFTSVFAPTSIREKVVHVWQVRDGSTGQWTTTDRIGFDMVGGRDEGYRGSTRKRQIRKGEWRVSVETESGKILSRIPFSVVDFPQTGTYYTMTATK